jgi:hypothetical protein
MYDTEFDNVKTREIEKIPWSRGLQEPGWIATALNYLEVADLFEIEGIIS